MILTIWLTEQPQAQLAESDRLEVGTHGSSTFSPALITNSTLAQMQWNPMTTMHWPTQIPHLALVACARFGSNGGMIQLTDSF
ncbi:hypothetical protein C7H85_03220 [Zobellella endophytica]|uniref:Uncharacterized protein n=2 Tax=Zobellella endophytica TaxID=2116700 RepID=A0A2P7RC72_9GAMM|nr:hypothetical protein C7H85_03220 [Zobellella endophytica]